MKKYDSSLIYFGDTVYNTDEGYYYTSNHCYEKTGEDKYKLLDKNIKLQPFTSETKKAVTCANLFPLSILLKNDEKKMVTKPMIELYRLKYMMLKSEFNNIYEEDIVASNKQNRIYWMYKK